MRIPFRHLHIILFLVCPVLGFSQKPDLRFKHISSIDGLSHNFIRNIVQDSKGFMWFATADGLNRYDGYKVKFYKNEIGNNKSLNHNDVWLLFENSRKELLIGTRFGLDIYNHDQDNFLRDPVIGSRNVSCITEDNDKNVWVCTWGELFYFDKTINKFKKYECEGLDEYMSQLTVDSKGNFWLNSKVNGLFLIDKVNRKLIPQTALDVNQVNFIYEDKKQNLWIASWGVGLILYDPIKKTSQVFSNKVNDPNSNTILTIGEDADGNLWLGTENGGLYIFNTKTHEFYNYKNNEIDPQSLGSNSIYKIYKDRNDNMWLGTFGAGVEFTEIRSFTHIKKNVLDKNSLSSNNISFLQEDAEGNLWIGTDGEGLNMLDRETGIFKHYKHDPQNMNSLSNNVVTEIYEDKEGYLWLGYWAGGVDRFDRRKNEFVHFRSNGKDPTSLWDDNIVRIYEDKQGVLWFGTGNGLGYLDRKSQKFISYNNIPALKSFTGDILEDSENRFWVGTFDGLNLFNRETKENYAFLHTEKDSTSLSNNMVYDVFEDSKKNVWIATAGGLNLFNKKTRTFKNYTKKDGLPVDAIYGILEDDHNNLWLSTSNGLCKFNPSAKTFKTYTVSDGLQGNFFKENTFLKTKKGELLFGGNNGFNILNPDNIKSNSVIPPVFITDFRIFNLPVEVGKKGSPLTKQITESKEIVLSYEQSVFSFDFTALNYRSPEKNEYAYILEGLENDWNYVGNMRTSTYTHLDPGEYVFKVKASNNDGLWNEEGTSISIIVTPPFWQTLWFKSLAGLFILSAALGLHSYRLSSIKKQKAKLEEKVRLRTQEISSQKEELAAQSDILQATVSELDFQKQHVETLFNELTDSIKAAQVIQNSILPSITYIKQFLPDLFILHKPKDVVGGDFYWFNAINGNLVFAAVDCTGHGVSGAFMSITGHHLLNKCILPYEDLLASQILDRLNKEIIEELNQNTEEDKILDGMDISICIINKKENTLQYAGASNPLYLIRDNELKQIRGDKHSVGLSITGEINPFVNNVIDIQKGDALYLFSDGYADQLGGEHGTDKFLYSRFRKLLLEINEKDMDQQLSLLDQSLSDWKKNQEQLDDVLVIGFRI
ncbi:MAG TPA: two-component regulator propeller domain-containing protein [Cytophagales bacterium]|nr:two-component regulator propeller domain-containing protein [Cytophagales bacterium]